VKKYVPKRGHIAFTNFDPAAGHEQAMRRPALVLSPEAFNQKIKLALVAPITSRIRGHGFEVKLEGTKTQGVVLCHQIKIIDYNARGIRFIESAPEAIVQDALAKIRLVVT
jgi:mRNA interferase MazF